MKRDDIPKELFRFRSASTDYFEDELTRAVTKQEHYYSTIEGQNDPFDCNPVLTKSSDRELLQFYRNIGRRFVVSEEIVQAHNPNFTPKMIKKELKENFAIGYENIRKTRKLIRRVFEKYRRESKGIYLTEHWESPLHWAHYADSHSGIAYVLTVDLPSAQITDDDIPAPMQYVSERPTVSDIDFLCWIEGIEFPKYPEYELAGERAFDALNFTKSAEWSYEKEWRVQKRFVGPSAYMFTPALRVSGVILGARCSDKATSIVKEVCSGRCEVHQARLHEQKFHLLADKLVL